jgi:hypothetical protein
MHSGDDLLPHIAPFLEIDAIERVVAGFVRKSLPEGIVEANLRNRQSDAVTVVGGLAIRCDRNQCGGQGAGALDDETAPERRMARVVNSYDKVLGRGFRIRPPTGADDQRIGTIADIDLGPQLVERKPFDEVVDMTARAIDKNRFRINAGSHGEGARQLGEEARGQRG